MKEKMAAKTVNKTIVLTVALQVELRNDDKYVVAYCPALELSAFGTNKETAKKRFIDEVTIFFTETERKGTLEKYLLKLGWTLTQKPVPAFIPPRIDIPAQYAVNTFTENVAIPVY